jgi:hypothetical protein
MGGWDGMGWGGGTTVLLRFESPPCPLNTPSRPASPSPPPRQRLLPLPVPSSPRLAPRFPVLVRPSPRPPLTSVCPRPSTTSGAKYSGLPHNVNARPSLRRANLRTSGSRGSTALGVVTPRQHQHQGGSRAQPGSPHRAGLFPVHTHPAANPPPLPLPQPPCLRLVARSMTPALLPVPPVGWAFLHPLSALRFISPIPMPRP